MTDKPQIPGIDIKPHDWEELTGILETIVPEYDVRAFGSRVEGTAKPYSDLDLAIITVKPLPLSKKADLREALDQSDLSIKVDIIDWSTISANFRKIIEQKNLLIQKASDKIA